MHNGTICSVRCDKGFGFIKSPGHTADIFFHCNDLVDLEFDEQLIERRIQFTLTSSSKGHRAREIQPAE